MRLLNKGPVPAILAGNEVAWTNALVATVANGQKPTEAMIGRYRHPEIKGALLSETAGKCAYCESKVRHIAYGDIEHVVPKSKVPTKAYAWDNLTIACDVCNTNKGDHYTADPASSQDNLIDPYVDRPNDHFLFLREVVCPRPDSLRGKMTESVIKLTRSELLERRRERMDFVDGLVRAYTLAPPEFQTMLLRDLYENHLADVDEYAGVSAAYIEHLQSKGVLPIAA
jgi:uncharacterized protein (TIGR02646 family)